MHPRVEGDLGDNRRRWAVGSVEKGAGPGVKKLQATTEARARIAGPADRAHRPGQAHVVLRQNPPEGLKPAEPMTQEPAIQSATSSASAASSSKRNMRPKEKPDLASVRERGRPADTGRPAQTLSLRVPIRGNRERPKRFPSSSSGVCCPRRHGRARGLRPGEAAPPPGLPRRDPETAPSPALRTSAQRKGSAPPRAWRAPCRDRNSGLVHCVDIDLRPRLRFGDMPGRRCASRSSASAAPVPATSRRAPGSRTAVSGP